MLESLIRSLLGGLEGVWLGLHFEEHVTESLLPAALITLPEIVVIYARPVREIMSRRTSPANDSHLVP